MKKSARNFLRENTGSHWWNISRDRIFVQVIESLMIPRASTVLELGVGTGSLLSKLCFTNKIGVDLDSCEYAVNHLNFRFVQADIQSLPFKDSAVDLLLLNDALEHIENDGELIKMCFKLLKPNGKILISVPALQILWSDLDEQNMHFRRYTAQKLNKLLLNSGLKYRVIKGSYINFFLFPPIFAIRLAQKLVKIFRKDYDTSCFKRPNNIINHILMYIFTSEGIFLRFLNFPIGISYFCLIEKV